MIYASMYTKGTPYETEVWPVLRASLERFDLSYDVEELEQKWKPDGTNDWLAACHQIPVVCLAMLERYHGDSLVWLDADATVEREPELFAELEAGDVDFAVHWMDHGNGRLQLADGTMWMRNCSRVRELLREWIADDARKPEAWEQQVLQDGIDAWAKLYGVKVQNLPATYCRIFDNDNQRKQLNGEDPVIVHWQASRAFKNMRKADNPIGVRPYAGADR